MNILEAIHKTSVDNKVKIRQRGYKLKEYKNEYGEIYVLNKRYSTFITKFIDKQIGKYNLDKNEISDLVIKELNDVKESIKTEYQNTWLKVTNFTVDEVLAKDWEEVK